MGSIDNVVFQALTVVLTLVGLVSSGVLWRARGPASGLRMLAIALLPAAAYLTGTLKLIWEIGDAVVSWSVRFAFSPFVWLGIVVGGVSAVLFAVASGMRKRGVGTKGRAPRRKEVSTDPALPAGPSRPPARSPKSAPETEDMADIEAILKKHGIS